MTDVVVVVMMLLGAIWMLLAGIGLLRFPDLFSRMQAATKAGVLASACLAGAAAAHFGRVDVTTEALLITLFWVLTGPTAAHRIARASYRMGIPLWSGTHRDELRDVVKRPEEPPSEEV